MQNPHRLLAALFAFALAACASPGTPPGEAVPGDPTPGAVNPPAAAPTVAIDEERALGGRGARIVLIEFADYQCPYCRTFHMGAFLDIKRAYVDTGLVRYFYKDFPLPGHAHAMDASVAAHCAGAQGKYGSMQDRLYEEQARLGEELYTELAAALALDAKQFQACMRGAPARQAVERDLREARALGVKATPTFMLGRIENGRVVVQRIAEGAAPFESFAREIEALLVR